MTVGACMRGTCAHDTLEDCEIFYMHAFAGRDWMLWVDLLVLQRSRTTRRRTLGARVFHCA